jgi:glycosyltransferase involved in cell wall biosynthesis
MATRPTVAVDINPATRTIVTGTETFTREICRRLPGAAPEFRWRFFASRARGGLGVDVTVLPMRRLWSQVRLPLHLASERPDLLFVPAHVVPFGWFGRSLAVIHDLAFERYPDAYSNTERLYLQVTTRWAVARCRLLIAVSESTKQDLVELYRAAPERVRVVPLGVSTPSTKPAPATRLKELGVDGSFVLQVGRIEPRKNQAAALAAIERLDGVQLVAAGAERDPGLAARLRASKKCRVLGMVDQPTLELLYDGAAAIVVPSLYEGFGLPVLEAMARGKVVVAAKTSSLPEVGGGGALYFHDPADVDDLARVLETALSDQQLRKTISAAAVARAAEFTWDRTAKMVAGGGQRGVTRPVALSIARQVRWPARSQLNWAARRMPRWRMPAARSLSSSTFSSALRHASGSPAGTTSPASATTTGRLEVSDTITGVPHAMPSSGGRPNPSYHAGCATTRARL